MLPSELCLLHVRNRHQRGFQLQQLAILIELEKKNMFPRSEM